MTRFRAFALGALAALVVLLLVTPEPITPEPPREQKIEALLASAERIDEPDQPKRRYVMGLHDHCPEGWVLEKRLCWRESDFPELVEEQERPLP